MSANQFNYTVGGVPGTRMAGHSYRILEGEKTLSLSVRGQILRASGIKVNAKKETVFKLAALNAVWSDDLTSVDFGDPVTLKMEVSDGIKVMATFEKLKPNDQVTRFIVPVVPGNYQFSFQMPEGVKAQYPAQSHQIKQGETLKVDLSPKKEHRGILRVQRDPAKYPEPKELNCRVPMTLVDWGGTEGKERPAGTFLFEVRIILIYFQAFSEL